MRNFAREVAHRVEDRPRAGREVQSVPVKSLLLPFLSHLQLESVEASEERLFLFQAEPRPHRAAAEPVMEMLSCPEEAGHAGRLKQAL